MILNLHWKKSYCCTRAGDFCPHTFKFSPSANQHGSLRTFRPKLEYFYPRVARAEKFSILTFRFSILNRRFALGKNVKLSGKKTPHSALVAKHIFSERRYGNGLIFYLVSGQHGGLFMRVRKRSILSRSGKMDRFRHGVAKWRGT